ncbi:hypothetical protein BKA56DRAFT_662329 [Ilyonectria sp. MPI-CAGE-AT-0026]|nr:hypothetical protein BKA56DRAFT_662329 [Ilyonectria sp. MPI-CAGE-AT-0026]
MPLTTTCPRQWSACTCSHMNWVCLPAPPLLSCMFMFAKPRRSRSTRLFLGETAQESIVCSLDSLTWWNREELDGIAMGFRTMPSVYGTHMAQAARAEVGVLDQASEQASHVTSQRIHSQWFPSVGPAATREHRGCSRKAKLLSIWRAEHALAPAFHNNPLLKSAWSVKLLSDRSLVLSRANSEKYKQAATDGGELETPGKCDGVGELGRNGLDRECRPRGLIS